MTTNCEACGEGINPMSGKEYCSDCEGLGDDENEMFSEEEEYE